MKARRAVGSLFLVFLLALLALLASGCVAPARDRGAYRSDALQAVQSALSETRAGQLAVETYLSGDATAAYADTVVTDSEDALAPIQASFGTVQPPTPGEDSLRVRVSGLLTDAADALTQARIAMRRDDTTGLREAAAALGDVGTRLEAEQEALK